MADVTDSNRDTMTEDQFGILNREFLHSCIGNVETLGTNCCLAPLAADYLNQCLKLMDPELANEESTLAISELAKRLKLISGDFETFAEVLKKNDQVKKVKKQPEPSVTSSIPPSFSFDSSSNTINPSSGFFGTTSTITTTSESNVKAEEDPDEVQEKEAQAHEFVPVTENDSLFTTRCKIFQKPKDKTAYEVRGIGQLYIQKTDDGSHRILVRADNSLGTILLNMKITADIPATVNLAKKQVLTVDPHQQCPISFLVKTTELAQSLFDTIESCQQKSV